MIGEVTQVTNRYEIEKEGSAQRCLQKGGNPDEGRSRDRAGDMGRRGANRWRGWRPAGQPDREQLERLAEAGYTRTVIDLRTPEEPRGFDEPEIVGRVGMEYANIR